MAVAATADMHKPCSVEVSSASGGCSQEGSQSLLRMQDAILEEALRQVGANVMVETVRSPQFEVRVLWHSVL